MLGSHCSTPTPLPPYRFRSSNRDHGCSWGGEVPLSTTTKTLAGGLEVRGVTTPWPAARLGGHGASVSSAPMAIYHHYSYVFFPLALVCMAMQYTPRPSGSFHIKGRINEGQPEGCIVVGAVLSDRDITIPAPKTLIRCCCCAVDQMTQVGVVRSLKKV